MSLRISLDNYHLKKYSRSHYPEKWGELAYPASILKRFEASSFTIAPTAFNFIVKP